MSAFFPHVNLNALKKFAAVTAAAEHPSRSSGRNPRKVNPQVASCEDIEWAGEKVCISHSSAPQSSGSINIDVLFLSLAEYGIPQMILITFEKKTLPLGPHLMLAHFPRGRPRLATQAVVCSTDISYTHILFGPM